MKLPLTGAHLLYGDNLVILRKHVPDASVDLVYLDPSFNSNANYGVLFKGPSGQQSQGQIEAFEDTWHWNASAQASWQQQVVAMLRNWEGLSGAADIAADEVDGREEIADALIRRWDVEVALARRATGRAA